MPEINLAILIQLDCSAAFHLATDWHGAHCDRWGGGLDGQYCYRRCRGAGCLWVWKFLCSRRRARHGWHCDGHALLYPLLRGRRLLLCCGHGRFYPDGSDPGRGVRCHMFPHHRGAELCGVWYYGFYGRGADNQHWPYRVRGTGSRDVCGRRVL